MAPQIVKASFSAGVIEFVRLLWRFKVRSLMVGGEAVISHGYPRLTGDVDFFYERTRAAINEPLAGRKIWTTSSICPLRKEAHGD